VKFGAVIAAAGLSSRMGAFKPLLPLGGSTIIERIVCTLRAGGVEDITVVTGRDASRIEEVLSSGNLVFDDKTSCNITYVYNKDYASTDMFYSVSMGFADIAERADAVFFTPVDVPLFTVNTMRLLTERLQNSCGRPEGADHIISPIHKGKLGHPILMLPQALKELIKWKGPGGLRGAIDAYGGLTEILEIDDPGVVFDADTPEDYQLLTESVKS
jgi:CTP:molybdopterin cytidylyltransferase MocA